MLRRIPWAPLFFGIFLSWAVLSMLASEHRDLSSIRVYVIVGAVGGGAMLLLFLVAQLIPRRPAASTGRSIGRGCAYAAAGFMFVLPVTIVTGMLSGRGIVVHGIGPGILVLIAYTGLGILAGIWYGQFARAEEERRQSALAAQAAEFAKEQLEIARGLQQRLLPPAPFEHAKYRIDARNEPAIYVAGDFYDFIPLPRDRVLVVVADVAGKGVAAGLIMATTKGIIPLLAAEEDFVAPLAGRLNARLSTQLSKRDFVAAALAIYDAASGSLSIANAGLPDPIAVAQNGVTRAIVVPGPRYPLGIRADLDYEAITLKLAPGERVVFFTDGLPEAIVAGEPLGYERLQEEIGSTRGDIGALFARVNGLASGTRDDDWTAVSIERMT